MHQQSVSVLLQWIIVVQNKLISSLWWHLKLSKVIFLSYWWFASVLSSSQAYVSIFTQTECFSLCLPQPHWLATRPWLVILYRNSDSSVVWTDMECPEERLWYGAASGRPPRPQHGASVLDHSEGKPAGHPITSMTFALWKLAGVQSVKM